MRVLAVALLAVISLKVSAQNKGWGVDTLNFDDSSNVVNFEAKQGISIYSGVFVTEDAGAEVKVSTFFGKGKVKLGFNLNYVYSHFPDSVKKNRLEDNPFTPFGAIGFGLTSRLYNQSNQVHITTSANYMVSFGDDRFKSTNGVNLKFALGVNLNEYLYLQGGLMAQTFLATTTERPTNVGFTLGLGVAL